MKKSVLCPCGGGQYSACCRPFHEGSRPAPTALALMRSRYSAFALGLNAYLIQTWHPSSRPEQLDAQADLLEGKWIGLTIKGDSETGDNAWVEFIARYKPNSGPATRLHEHSRFIREHGHWFYVDGKHSES